MRTLLASNQAKDATLRPQPSHAWQPPASISQHSEVLRAVCASHLAHVVIVGVLAYIVITSNIAQVSGGERELRTFFLKPFNRACVESMAIMTAYSSYDGIPAIANTRL